jgi:hypothetical protein
MNLSQIYRKLTSLPSGNDRVETNGNAQKNRCAIREAYALKIFRKSGQAKKLRSGKSAGSSTIDSGFYYTCLRKIVNQRNHKNEALVTAGRAV